MNRSLKQKKRKGCSYRKRGGGYEMGAPLVPFEAADDATFSVKVPINQAFSDCAFPARPGQINIEPRPELAQTVMAGGKRTRRRGGFHSHYMPVNTADTYKVSLPITQGFPNCGSNVQSRIMSQARPELAQTQMMEGGSCTSCMARRGGRRTRKIRGGNRGVSVDPWLNIGGQGPNAAPTHNPIPCDARSGSSNELSVTPVNPDPRAPANLYSLTPNQTGGGSYGLANGYSDACYKAPGSSLPVYPATTAGFKFEPSTGRGATMPDGVTAFNEVVPQAARVGGKRKRRTLRKHRALRKRRSSRK